MDYSIIAVLRIFVYNTFYKYYWQALFVLRYFFLYIFFIYGIDMVKYTKRYVFGLSLIINLSNTKQKVIVYSQTRLKKLPNKYFIYKFR